MLSKLVSVMLSLFFYRMCCCSQTQAMAMGDCLFLHQKAYINHTTGQFVFKTVALEKNTGLTKDNLDRYVEILHKTIFDQKNKFLMFDARQENRNISHKQPKTSKRAKHVFLTYSSHEK